jgi:hypothetical protein
MCKATLVIQQFGELSSVNTDIVLVLLWFIPGLCQANKNYGMRLSIYSVVHF